MSKLPGPNTPKNKARTAARLRTSTRVSLPPDFYTDPANKTPLEKKKRQQGQEEEEDSDTEISFPNTPRNSSQGASTSTEVHPDTSAATAAPLQPLLPPIVVLPPPPAVLPTPAAVPALPERSVPIIPPHTHKDKKKKPPSKMDPADLERILGGLKAQNMLPMPTFAGGKQNPSVHIQKVEDFCKYHDYTTNEQKVTALGYTLEGKARLWFEELEEDIKEDYKKLTNKFLIEFAKEGRSEQELQRLWTTIRYTESVDIKDFLRDVKTLAKILDKNEEDTVNILHYAFGKELRPWLKRENTLKDLETLLKDRFETDKGESKPVGQETSVGLFNTLQDRRVSFEDTSKEESRMLLQLKEIEEHRAHQMEELNSMMKQMMEDKSQKPQITEKSRGRPSHTTPPQVKTQYRERNRSYSRDSRDGSRDHRRDSRSPRPEYRYDNRDNRHRSQNRNYKDNYGRDRYRSQSRGRPFQNRRDRNQSRDRRGMYCSRCNKTNHTWFGCYSNPKNKNNRGQRRGYSSYPRNQGYRSDQYYANGPPQGRYQNMQNSQQGYQQSYQQQSYPQQQTQPQGQYNSMQEMVETDSYFAACEDIHRDLN